MGRARTAVTILPRAGQFVEIFGKNSGGWSDAPGEVTSHVEIFASEMLPKNKCLRRSVIGYIQRSVIRIVNIDKTRFGIEMISNGSVVQ